jgi:hypothetical protein
MTREEMKMMFLQMDCSNIPVKKQIIVDLRYLDNKWWPNYGYVQVLKDGPDGYCSFSTHQENPLEYAKSRKEYKSGEYELIIKE